MPRRKSTLIEDARPMPEPEVSGFRKLLAFGTRATTGALAGAASAVPGPGTLLGSAVAGGGESLAELLEGSKQNPYRIGVEAGLGAVPFGKWIGAATKAKPLIAPIRDFVTGGIASGAGELGREWAEGEEIDPLRVGTTTVGGGALAAGGGALIRKLFGGRASNDVIPPTRERGVKTRGGDVIVNEPTPPTAGKRRFSDKQSYDEFKQAQAGGRVVKTLGARDIRQSDSEAQFDFAEDVRKAMNKELGGLPDTYSKNLKGFEGSLNEAAAEATARRRAVPKLESEQLAADEFLRTIEGKTKTVTAARTSSVATPQGKKSVTTKYTTPKEDGDGEAMFTAPKSPTSSGFVEEAVDVPAPPDPVANLKKIIKPGKKDLRIYAEEMPPEGTPAHADFLDWLKAGVPPKQAVKNVAKGHKFSPPSKAIEAEMSPESKQLLDDWMKVGVPPTPAVMKSLQRVLGPAPSSQVAEVVPEAPKQLPKTPLTRLSGVNFFPNRVSAMDDAYAQMSKAKEAGEMSPEAAKTAQKVLGKGLGKEKNAFTLRHKTTGDWSTEALNALKAAGGKLPKDNQAGFIAPELASATGGGIVGAGVGATQEEGPYAEEWKNRTRNAALGGIAGAGLGYGAGRLPQMSGEEIKKAGSDLYYRLPNLLRFNYLMSTPITSGSTGIPIGATNVNPGGLLANAIAGPYGSAVSGGLEDSAADLIHGGSGKRGMDLLRQLSPANYAKNYLESFDESIRHLREGELGRGEFNAIPNLMNKPSDALNYDTLTAAPGVAMMMGDVTSRNLAERARFSPAEAREMTLTNEVENAFLRRLQDSAKGSPFAQLLFPFRRTPLNIVEQGLRRIPGVGFLAQLSRGANADDWQTQVAQQGLGAAYGLGGYAVGRNVDPETAKWLRRYVTNFSGRYSLPAGIGFTAGQAHAQGRRAIPALTNPMRVDDYLPLPTLDPILDTARFIGNAVDDIPNNARPPRGVAPPAVYDALFPADEAQVSRRRSRRF